jgi:hypothetical protein
MRPENCALDIIANRLNKVMIYDVHIPDSLGNKLAKDLVQAVRAAHGKVLSSSTGWQRATIECEEEDLLFIILRSGVVIESKSDPQFTRSSSLYYDCETHKY